MRYFLSLVLGLFLFAPQPALAGAYDGTYIHNEDCYDVMKIRNNKIVIKVSGGDDCFNATYNDRMRKISKRGFVSKNLNCRKSGKNLICVWIDCDICMGRDLFVKQ